MLVYLTTAFIIFASKIKSSLPSQSQSNVQIKVSGTATAGNVYKMKKIPHDVWAKLELTEVPTKRCSV